MLSIKAFSSADAASSYYSHGDYYGSEGEGVWLGKSAEELDLGGRFAAKSDKGFNDLIRGVLPNGQVLGRKTKDGVEHRPGIDLTFSCPKSFSLQMLLYAKPEEKKDLEAAMMKAVGSTLGYIEQQGYAFVRKGDKGKIKESINKLAFATFAHTTNRNLEPQAHVHCFLANAAKCSDGKYRSLTYDKILENNKFLGQVFRNELASQTKNLGYDIKTKILSDGSSSFELANIDQKVINAFSTRRKEIVELCKLYGVTTKEGRDKIVINSRKAKKSVHEQDLIKAWQALDKNIKNEIDKDAPQKLPNSLEPTQSENKSSLGKFLDVIKTIGKSPKVSLEPDNEKPLSAKDLALLCIEDVTYHKTVFTQEELLKKILKYSAGNYTINEIQGEVSKLEKSGVLIRNGDLLTTKAMLDKETKILDYAQKAIGQSKQIMAEKYFRNHLAKFENRELAKDLDFKINNQQRSVMKYVLTSQDKIIAVNGLPGVGKSTVLNGVRSISGQKIISLIGFGEDFKGTAPTASASNTLQSSAKVESATLHSFLGKYQGYIESRGKSSLPSMKAEFKKTMIFLDEGSLVSTNIMHKLLKLQAKFGFRLVLTGDTKQLGSVEAGKPFEQILRVIPSIKMDQIVRQKNIKHQEAIIAASKGNIAKTFDIHKDNIKEKTTPTAIINEAVNLYMSKDKEQRDQTLLISPTRDIRDKINNKIKNVLTDAKVLKSNKTELTSLKQKDMTTTDLRFASSFKQGDILKFNSKYKNGIAKDDYLEVKSVNEISNSLILNKNGKDLMFNLRKNIDYQSKFEVFTNHKLELQEGLKIIFTKNNKELGLINSQTGVIEKLDNKNVTILLEDKTVKIVPLSQLKHIDYGYCTTIHSAQGKTYNNTIAAITNNKLLNNQKSWLVAMSRHRNEFTALVEDKAVLSQYLVKNKGDDMSSIELISRQGDNDKSLKFHKRALQMRTALYNLDDPSVIEVKNDINNKI